jgi:hypothetical protein
MHRDSNRKCIEIRTGNASRQPKKGREGATHNVNILLPHRVRRRRRLHLLLAKQAACEHDKRVSLTICSKKAASIHPRSDSQIGRFSLFSFLLLFLLDVLIFPAHHKCIRVQSQVYPILSLSTSLTQTPSSNSCPSKSPETVIACICRAPAAVKRRRRNQLLPTTTSNIPRQRDFPPPMLDAAQHHRLPASPPSVATWRSA